MGFTKGAMAAAVGWSAASWQKDAPADGSLLSAREMRLAWGGPVCDCVAGRGPEELLWVAACSLFAGGVTTAWQSRSMTGESELDSTHPRSNLVGRLDLLLLQVWDGSHFTGATALGSSGGSCCNGCCWDTGVQFFWHPC